MKTSTTYRITTEFGGLFVRLARSGRKYAGERARVMLDIEAAAGVWTSRKRAEEVLAQATAQYPLSGLKIVAA